MTIEERNKAILEKTPNSVPTNARNALLVGIALGLAGVGIGFATHDSVMWGVLLVNFMLVAGLTVGGPVAAAVMSIVRAKWGRPVKRLFEINIFFAPYLLVFVALLFVGADQIWEWTLPHDEINLHGAKGAWLSTPFVFARLLVWLGILTGMGYIYVRKSVRPDAGLAQEIDASWVAEHPATSKAAAGFTTVKEEVERTHGFLDYFAPWFAGLYAICFAMIGYDLVMSVDPHWFSTMFGGWMFMQNLALTMAFMGIVTFVAKNRLRLDSMISEKNHHDIGKLTFGSSIFWAYLGFAQLIVIWYGNLPEETGFLLLRFTGAWRPVFFTVIALVWAAPFLVLMPKANKMHPTIYRVMAFGIISGIWLNFYQLIVPAVLKLAAHHGHEVAIVPTITLPAIMVTIGAVSSFVLVYLKSMTKYPVAPIADPYFELPEQHI